MTKDNARSTRAIKWLAAVSLLGAAMAITPVYAADAPAATQAAGQSMKMSSADQAKWAKQAKAEKAWHKSKADKENASAKDKKSAQ